MKCIYCKNEIPTSSKFCMCCGKRVIVCPACQYGPLPMVAVYCPNCGKKPVEKPENENSNMTKQKTVR